MTTDIVIRAQNLGKSYVIGHQTNQAETTMRDQLVSSFRSLGRSSAAMLRGKPIIAGDEAEEFWALRDVNFEIRRGEAVGIIGRNGAGKSTLLKILSRITQPTEGRVAIRGRVASLLEVGTGFHPELTGRENIYLNGAILGMTRSEIRAKFDEIVVFSGVERFLDTPVKRYSSGMYVRLAFSVAAHLEPEILIIDEVLAVGDAEFQKRCLGKMETFTGGGRTVIFVSHQLPSVARLCDRAILFENGGLRAQGTTEDIISLYRGEGASKVVDVNLPIDGEAAIQITQIRISNTDEVTARDLPLSLDAPLEIITRIRAHTFKGEVTVSFALLSPDGTVILASNSANAGHELAFEGPSERELSLTLAEGQLVNRELICRVALWNRTDGIIDHYETAPVRFTARDVDASPVKINGFVKVNSTWNVRQGPLHA